MKKNILIVGASSDVAQALAHLRAEGGHTLWLTGRSLEAIQPILSDLKIRYEVEALGFIYDAEKTAPNDLLLALPSLPDEVHIVFGYLGNPMCIDNPVEATRIMTVNFTAAVLLMNSLMHSYIQAKKQAVMVGISSVAGDRGRKSNFLYGSAKAGFSAYLDGLRNFGYAHGIHVVTVKPGFIRSKMTAGLPLPAPLTASPHQVANAVVKAIRKRKGRVYVLPIWALIMLVIRTIPDFIFKKLNL
jgi:decaprenylphospho-beta-D-erythro-pentofuranosid-2-ulose 2-reductase